VPAATTRARRATPGHRRGDRRDLEHHRSAHRAGEHARSTQAPIGAATAASLSPGAGEHAHDAGADQRWAFGGALRRTHLAAGS
jgi:hypothetical protein